MPRALELSDETVFRIFLPIPYSTSHFRFNTVHSRHLPPPRNPQYALGLVLSSGEGEDVGVPQDEQRARGLFATAARGEWRTHLITTAARCHASGAAPLHVFRRCCPHVNKRIFVACHLNVNNVKL